MVDLFLQRPFGIKRSLESFQAQADFPDLCVQPLEPSDAAQQRSCDVARGNWDCADGWGCTDGTCVKGASGELDVGLTCASADECKSGLCLEGACSVPCDADGACYAAASCDEAAAPGGLCIPLDCSADATVCGAPFTCVSGRCAIPASGCSCDQSTTPGTLAGFALFFALARLRRRRR